MPVDWLPLAWPHLQAPKSQKDAWKLWHVRLISLVRPRGESSQYLTWIQCRENYWAQQRFFCRFKKKKEKEKASRYQQNSLLHCSWAFSFLPLKSLARHLLPQESEDGEALLVFSPVSNQYNDLHWSYNYIGISQGCIKPQNIWFVLKQRWGVWMCIFFFFFYWPFAALIQFKSTGITLRLH